MSTHAEIKAAVVDYFDKMAGIETLDECWQENGSTFALVSPARRAQSDPPDSTVYRCTIRERSIGGDGYGDKCCGTMDAEYVHLEEVEFSNGAIGYDGPDR